MTISTGAKTMKALRFTEFLSSSVSRFGGISIPEPREGEALILVKAAAINPSDVGNVAGRFKNNTTLSRTPGRDFAGIVVKGKQHEGQEVWGELLESLHHPCSRRRLRPLHSKRPWTPTAG